MVIDRLFNVLKASLNDFIEKKEEEWGFDPNNEESSIESWLRKKEEELRQKREEREQRKASGDYGSQSKRRSYSKRKPTAAEKEKKAFKDLELAHTSDFKVIKKQYRKLMKKYHPDRHQEEKKRKAAEKVTAKLNQAYEHLEKIYGK